jgi:putative transposase
MTAEERRFFLETLAKPGCDQKRALKELGISRSTFYHWRKAYEEGGMPALEKLKPKAKHIWNRITPKEVEVVLAVAKAYPELSPRLLAVKITDEAEFSISESKVFSLLKSYGLIAPRPLPEYPAAKEWRHKTSRPNEIWQIDGTNLFVANWGYYKLIPILDDYSRKIVAWILAPDESAQSASEAVEAAIDAAGIKKFKPEDRPMLLSDNGAGFSANILSEYLGGHKIRHIFGRPYHPQTQGKVERFNRRIKERLCLIVHESPDRLREAIGEAIEAYNQTPHEALKNVSPNDVYAGKRDEILNRRAQKKAFTLQMRKKYNLKLDASSGKSDQKQP